MLDDTENKENTSESTEPEKAETEPQVQEVIPEPEVLEIVVETTPKSWNCLRSKQK